MAQFEDPPLELQIDLALAHYMQKCDAGDVPNRELFLAQHPELRAHLEELLAAADWIEQLAGPRLSEVASRAAPQLDATVSPNPGNSELGNREPGNSATDEILSGTETTAVYHANPPTAFAPMNILPQPAPDETLPQGLIYANRSHSLQDTLPQRSGQGCIEYSLDEDAAVPQSSQPALPCRFGDYVLERVLGRGGMGVVYFGRQVQLERPVAVKMIRSGALASSEEVARFYSEARSAARLDHPNIVTVYQCGECQGHHYFSMDYVDGTDLARMVQTTPLTCKQAARYVRDVARAIQYAHDRGILHRDLKPANVLIDRDDQVHITDFGLAKTVGTDTGLTASGAALGTPSYMSPEQAAGRISEQRQATDIYSLGAVLFTIVTGQPPFKGAGIVQTIMHVIHRPAPLAGSVRSDLPQDLETIIDVCLQKTPERRYLSAAALADDLNRFLLGSPIQARPAPRWRRGWYWLLGIPVIGAVLDHRVIEPTEAHRWVQRGLISVALLCLLVWLIAMIPTPAWVGNRMPPTVHVAGGVAGGSYAHFADAISQILMADSNSQVETVSTVGSSDNAERLQRGEVDLALLQSDVITLPSIAVAAPLYYEAVHILVRSDSEIEKTADLKQRQVVLGSEKAGVRMAAELLLRRAGLSLEDIRVDDSEWHSLLSQPEADAAVVVTQAGAVDLVELLAQGDYRLLPIADAMQFALDEPIFHPLLLTPASYPGCSLPAEGIITIATTAFLACREDAPPILVETVLRNLYSPEFIQQNGILSPDRASRWPVNTWHPAARKYFQAYQGSSVGLK